MRYIDADKLKRDLEEYKKRLDELYPHLECEDDRLVCGASASELNVIVSMIDDAPTAEVGEVRHGRWIRQAPNKDYLEALHKEGVALGMGVHSIYWNCSECGGWGGLYHKYCSNCGAKMDGKKDGGI